MKEEIGLRKIMRLSMLLLCIVLMLFVIGCNGNGIKTNVWQDISFGILLGISDFDFNIINGIPLFASGGLANVQQYKNKTWENLGNQDFSIGPANDIKLAFEDGYYFAAFYDRQVERGIVTKYREGVWERVGKTGYFSNGEVHNLSMVVKDQTPYISYQDFIDYKFKVAKVTGDEFILIGGIPLSEYETIYSLKLVSKNGEIYLIVNGTCPDGYNLTTKIKVLKLDDLTWNEVGSFDPGKGICSFSVDTYNNQFYFAYTVWPDVRVVKYDELNWSELPDPQIYYQEVETPGLYGKPPIAEISAQNGQLYLLYRDCGHNLKASVKKLNGSTWDIIGAPGFSENVLNGGVIVNDNNTIYVCYQEIYPGNYWSDGSILIKRYIIAE